VNVLGEPEREAVASVLASLEQDVEVTLELGPTAAAFRGVPRRRR